MSFVLRKCTC